MKVSCDEQEKSATKPRLNLVHFLASDQHFAGLKPLAFLDILPIFTA
jgi:hypothetical protein